MIMSPKVLKIVGIAAIVVGTVAMYLAGSGESTVIALISAVFVLGGIIAGIFGLKAVEPVKKTVAKKK